ncbi:hypothetical protein BRC74_04675, partial [Halobacteriales archaeon QH_7_68_42]
MTSHSGPADRDTLYFFESGVRPFYSADEVATEFDLDRSQAHRRLEALGESGDLERVAVGERNAIWWRPRDAVVLVEEGDGYSVLDTTTGVASQGATDVSPDEVYEELEASLRSASRRSSSEPPFTSFTGTPFGPLNRAHCVRADVIDRLATRVAPSVRGGGSPPGPRRWR